MAKTRPKVRKPVQASAAKPKSSPNKPKLAKRPDSKQSRLIAMLRTPGGATIAQIVKAFGWQPHTVRGVFSGALKKKLGLTVTSEKAVGGERVYRLAS